MNKINKIQKMYAEISAHENGKGFYVKSFRQKENKVGFVICDKITDIFCYVIVANL